MASRAIAGGGRQFDARVFVSRARARTTRASTFNPSKSASPKRIPTPDSRIPSLSVNPAELRAIGSLPTSTHAVWLPSTIRCSRIHVVNGSRRTALRRCFREIEHDEAEVARLQDERERANRLSSARWFMSPHSPGW